MSVAVLVIRKVGKISECTTSWGDNGERIGKACYLCVSLYAYHAVTDILTAMVNATPDNPMSGKERSSDTPDKLSWE